MKKRLFFNEVRTHDLKKDTCYIRELEMVIESGIIDQMQVIQFRRDFEVYGLREAILFLTNGDYVKNEEEVVAKANEILKVFGRTNFIEL